MKSDKVKRNLVFLRKRNNLTNWKEMSEILGVSAAQLSNVLHGKQEPSSFFLERIRECFGYSIDDFLYRDLEAYEKEYFVNQADGYTETAYRFRGAYLAYYYSQGYMKYGILLIKNNRGSQKMCSVLSVLDLKKDYAESRYEQVKNYTKEGGYDNAWNYLASLHDKKHLGKVYFSDRYMFLNLREEEKGDQVNLSFHRPEEQEFYHGGLGTMSAVDRAADAYYAPQLKYIGLSDRVLVCGENELKEHLSFQNKADIHTLYREVSPILIDFGKEGKPESQYLESVRNMVVCEKLYDIIDQLSVQNEFVVTMAADYAWKQLLEPDRAYTH